jgi:DNA ligase-1
MLEALAKASGIAVERVRRAAMMAGSAIAIARTTLENGEAGLAQFDIQLFRPVQPMLAGTAEDMADALHEIGEAALEYKLDGARVQAHKSGEEVAIYSRQGNDVTIAVPEVVAAVRALPAQNLILDGEVLSLLPDGRPQPFQVSMRRFGRRLDVASLAQELPMTPFWFDLLYLDGKPLVDAEQSARFTELASLAPANNLIPSLVTADAARAEEFLHSALARGHEGVMAKSRASTYAAGARGQSWLKIKQARTLDLVILGAEWGSGRRRGWLSNLHLGARDTHKGGFAMLGKTFKGLTDEMLSWQTGALLNLEVARDKYAVYVYPRLVVEIAFNEIQVSSRYVSGLALRFARVKRYREDKSAADSDTFETVQRLAGLIG